MKTNKLRTTAIILSMFVGLAAIYGGWMLIADPSGQTLQFPLELLNDTPFNDYFIPGLILFIIIGVYSFLVAIFSMSKFKNYTWLIIINGCLLIGWLTIELIMNKSFFLPEYHYPLYAIGALLIIIGYFEKKLSIKPG